MSRSRVLYGHCWSRTSSALESLAYAVEDDKTRTVNITRVLDMVSLPLVTSGQIMPAAI